MEIIKTSSQIIEGLGVLTLDGIGYIQLQASYQKKVGKSYEIKSSSSAYQAFRELFNQETFLLREELILLCLNNAHKVIGGFRLSTGGIEETVADIRVAAAVAILCGATKVMLGHNHPSGRVQPSQGDNKITEKFKKAFDLLDIKLIDHLILGDNCYYSYADEGNI